MSLGLCLLVLIAAACDVDAKAKTNFVFKESSRSDLAAKINGEDITENDLIGDAALDLLQIKKQEYDLKMAQLNKMVAEKTLLTQAKKEGLSGAEEYIQQKILKDDIKITDSEYKKFVKEKNILESNLNDQVKERIYAYMKEQKRAELVQARVEKLNKGRPVEVYFKKPKSNIQVETGDAPTTGGEHAKVTFVEFSDFQCPFCGKASKTLEQVRKKYGNKVRFVFKQFPLPMHKDAKSASEASLCVAEQGKEKFWKFHDIAFQAQDKLDPESLLKDAKAAGVDEPKFRECFASHKYASEIAKDQAQGEKIGIRYTPSFFINGQYLSGALPLEAFSEVIDQELAAVN